MEKATTFAEFAADILNCDQQIFLAYDAQQALQLVRHLGGAVALVDLDSTASDGLWLIRRIRATFPHLRVVAISKVLGVP